MGKRDSRERSTKTTADCRPTTAVQPNELERLEKLDRLEGWNAWKWWRNDISRRYVISEYLKLGYFVYKYNFDSKYFDNGIEHRAEGIGKKDATGKDEKEHERLRQIEKKWENKINDWIIKIEAHGSKVKGKTVDNR